MNTILTLMIKVDWNYGSQIDNIFMCLFMTNEYTDARLCWTCFAISYLMSENIK